MNRTELIGRITKDIELRKTQSGKSVTSFTLAVNKPVKDSTADFIPCMAWDKTAEFLSNYVHKGDQIGVEGRINTRSYKNQQGQTIYVTEVIADRVELLQKKEAKTDTVPAPEEPPAVDDDFLPF